MLGNIVKIVKIDWVQGIVTLAFYFLLAYTPFYILKNKQTNKATNKQNQILTRCPWILELHDAPKMTYTIPWG